MFYSAISKIVYFLYGTDDFLLTVKVDILFMFDCDGLATPCDLIGKYPLWLHLI